MLKFRLTPFQKLQFKFMCLVVMYIRNSSAISSKLIYKDKSKDIILGTSKMGSEFEKWEVE